MNFSFPVTTSPEYFCLGDSVQLTCSAQNLARWTSDGVLGPGQTITCDQIGSPGNGTAILNKTSPGIVTSLSFKLISDKVEINCTDGLTRNTTIVASVQPSECQINCCI